MIRNYRSLLFLLLLPALALVVPSTASAQINLCLEDPMGGPCCGDGICELGESCSIDCSVCGDGVCSGLETCASCSGDCGACPTCGDGICNGSETCATCSDCTSCFQAPFQAFHRGENTEYIYYTYSFDGTSWSTSRRLGNGAQSSRGPAAVVFNNRMYVFYRGESSPRIYYSWSDDGLVWHGNIQLGNGAETDEGVGATVFKNRIYVFNAGKNTRDLWVSHSADGSTWDNHRRISAPTDEVKGSPSAAVLQEKVGDQVVAERMFIYYRHDSNRIKGLSTADGQSYVQEPTTLRTGNVDGVGLTAFEGRLYMAIPQSSILLSQTSRGIYLQSRTLNTGWVFPSQIHVSGQLESNYRPGLAATGDRMLMVFKGRHTNDLFYAYRNSGPSLRWFGNQRAAGSTNHGGVSLIYTD